MDHRSIHRHIDDAIENLPALSPAVTQIIELANDLTATPKDLMAIIKTDPSLTGKILHLVNSTYFSLPTQITSLNRALILLGFNTIKSIALTSAFVESTKAKQRESSALLESTWMHLLSVGVTSKLLARAAGKERKILESFFIGGLMHDIGDMIMIKVLPGEVQKAVDQTQSKDSSFEQACKELMGITGPVVGEKLARLWKLPLNLSNIISRNSEELQNAEEKVIFETVFLADQICRSSQQGFVCDTIGCTIKEEDLQKLKLSRSVIEKVKKSIPKEVEHAKIFLKRS